VKKCISRIRQYKARRVGLQFPEGLLLFATAIGDILSAFTACETVVLGDVTFGACCVDDLGAAALGCDMLIHYGHSCLVPIDSTVSTVRMLYVFVDIAFDPSHLVDTIADNFPPTARLAVLGTIQFAPTLHALKAALAERLPSMHVQIPQAKPLSPGEVLGCTSPRLDPQPGQAPLDAFVFVADGRFHLESVMIHNPDLAAYRYDPYSKLMTREGYDTPAMHALRRAAIERAGSAQRFGIILGTLGRQGNPAIVDRLERKLAAAGKESFVLLLSEITPARLARFSGSVDAWVQVACPRLSIDWGHGFEQGGAAPLLTPYEAEVLLGLTEWRDVYPMDYYARGSGEWTNYHKPGAGTGGRGGGAGLSSGRVVG
jgi:2-(3-amino-3-carboxypropyl)histidine synthase